MPINVPYNGNIYTLPLPGENYGWGQGVTSYLAALAVPVQETVQIATATNGGISNIGIADTLILELASTIASYTVTLPTSPVAGRTVKIIISSPITASITTLTISASSTVKNTPTGLVAGAGIAYQFTGSYWARLY